VATSDEYKKQIMNELAEGNTEALGEAEDDLTKRYQTFDDFAERSSKEERRQLFGRSFHPDLIPTSQMEPELSKAIAQIKPNERDDVARAFFKALLERRLTPQNLEQQLGLSSHNPNKMTAEDVSKLSSFAYHSHPDIFQEVMADQPGIVKFLSNPIVGAIFGAIAAKWLGKHK
jgi:Glu-tRNA(Gln) amidotransferase subunit E-like FAD-binding protein